MLKTLFGDLKEGRLLRLPYFGYSFLLAALALSFGLAIIFAIGAGEHIIGGNLQQAQDKLRELLTLPFIIVFGLVSAMFVTGGINITAKRIRDIGLPGWWSVLAIIGLETIVSAIVSDQAAQGLHTLIWFALIVIPTDAFKKRV